MYLDVKYYKKKGRESPTSEGKKRLIDNIQKLQQANKADPIYSPSALSITTKAAITQKPRELLDNIMQNNWRLSPISNLNISRLFRRNKISEQSESEDSEDLVVKKPRVSLAAAFNKISGVPQRKTVLISKGIQEQGYIGRKLEYDSMTIDHDVEL